MWERPASAQIDTDPIEIPMFVTSVEVPEAESEGDREVGPAALAAGDPVLLSPQGGGTWPNGERAVRLGHAEEILITLPTNPFEAMDAARRSRILAQPIRGVRIDIDSRRDGDFEVSWKATLRAPVRWRAVSVRLYASPSLNVTVMTIIPEKARRISSRSFVRVGLRVARDFAQRIERELERQH